MHVEMHIRVHIHVHTYTCVCVCVCVCVHLFIIIYHLQQRRLQNSPEGPSCWQCMARLEYIRVCVCVCEGGGGLKGACIHACGHAYTRTHTCVCVYVFVCVCVCVCVCALIYHNLSPSTEETPRFFRRALLLAVHGSTTRCSQCSPLLHSQ